MESLPLCGVRWVVLLAQRLFNKVLVGANFAGSLVHVAEEHEVLCRGRIRAPSLDPNLSCARIEPDAPASCSGKSPMGASAESNASDTSAAMRRL